MKPLFKRLFSCLEVRMVSIDYIVESALRHDTRVADAFLAACGVRRRRRRTVRIGRVRTDADIAWCMANHGSPMDW